MSRDKPNKLDEAVKEVEQLIDIACEELKQRRQTSSERKTKLEENKRKKQSSTGEKKRRKLSPLAKSFVVGEILNRKF